MSPTPGLLRIQKVQPALLELNAPMVQMAVCLLEPPLSLGSWWNDAGPILLDSDCHGDPGSWASPYEASVIH